MASNERFAQVGDGSPPHRGEQQRAHAQEVPVRQPGEVVLPDQDRERADHRECHAGILPPGAGFAKPHDPEHDDEGRGQDRQQRPLARVRQVGAEELRRHRRGDPDSQDAGPAPIRPREGPRRSGASDHRVQYGGAHRHPEEGERDRRDVVEPPLAHHVHAAPQRRGEQWRGREQPVPVDPYRLRCARLMSRPDPTLDGSGGQSSRVVMSAERPCAICTSRLLFSVQAVRSVTTSMTSRAEG